MNAPPRRSEWTDRNSYQDNTWRVAIRPDEKGEALSWDEWRKIEVRTPDAEHEFRARAVRESGAGIYIRLERVPNEMLRSDVRATIVRAVSLTTMPVVYWE